MIPDQLRWALLRRWQLAAAHKGFWAHLFTYACPNSVFDDYVTLHRGSTVFQSRVGRATYIAGARLSNVKVGRFCSLGDGARLGLGRHPTDFISTHPAFYSRGGQTRLSFSVFGEFEESRAIVLGNDVWVGTGAIIMDGVSIGDGAIVGAGAVVTRDLPPYCIAVGVPARVIRFRFDDETIRRLLLLRWWDMPDVEIAAIAAKIAPAGRLEPDALREYQETLRVPPQSAAGRDDAS